MKYNLQQTIYYLLDNKVHSAPVLSIMEVRNDKEDLAYTKEQKELFTPFGKQGIKYATTHGIFPEEKVFDSKENLLKSL